MPPSPGGAPLLLPEVLPLPLVDPLPDVLPLVEPEVLPLVEPEPLPLEVLPDVLPELLPEPLPEPPLLDDPAPAQSGSAAMTQLSIAPHALLAQLSASCSALSLYSLTRLRHFA
jgi:hypothetical protein